jgi:hypothetical protein
MNIGRELTPGQLKGAVTRDIAKLRRRLERAIAKTAKGAVPIIRRHTPKAFGQLNESVMPLVSSGMNQTGVEAPYAAAVEIGSRPHWVPLDPIIEWVKRIGTLGLTASGSVTGSKASLRQRSRSVARELKQRVRKGSLAVDAPIEIAKRIQLHIATSGTKPRWFVRESLPEILALLDKNLQKAAAGMQRESLGSAIGNEAASAGAAND